MSKNSIDVYGAIGKTNTLIFDPKDLTLVQDKAHALYDPRINLPLDEALVLNIKAFGVLEPILITKDTESGTVMVVDGRQRTRAAVEANKRLAAEGCEQIRIPAVIAKGDGVKLAGFMVSTNELRQGDTAMGRAEKMQRLQEMGRTPDDLAVIFGCTKTTVASTLALLECTAAVRKAVESGQINITHAQKMSKMSPAEQRDTLAELIEAGAGKTGHAKAKATRAVIDKGPRMRSKRQINDALKDAHGEAYTTLMWVLGLSDTPPQPLTSQ